LAHVCPTRRSSDLVVRRSTPAAKRRQRVCRPCDRAPKYRRGSRRRCNRGGQHRRAGARRRARARHEGPTGVREQGMYTRDPQEPGRPCCFLGGRLRSGPGYRRTRKRSEARTSDGESECRSRTDDAGEPSRGTLPRKGRHRYTELLKGTMTKTPGSATISPKVQQVAKLAKEAPTMAFTTL